MVLAPLGVVRQLVARVLDWTGAGAELLAEAHGTGGAGLHALAAGNALLRVGLCHIGAAGEVRRVEKLAGAQSVADADGAVADAEYLILAVDVGYLMDIAALLGLAEYLHGLVVGYVVAFAGLTAVVGEIADAYAPLGLDVAGALVAHTLLLAAGAHGRTYMSFVFFQPVGEALYVQSLAVGGDGLFNGNDMHAYAGAAGRHHFRYAGKGQVGHTLEEIRDDGLLVAHVGVNDHELGAAGHEHVQHPALLVIRILAVEVFPMVLHEAGVAQDLKRFFEPCSLHFAALLNDFKGDGLALFQDERHIQRVRRGAHAVLVLRELHRGVHAPVLGRVGIELVHAEQDGRPVGDLLT